MRTKAILLVLGVLMLSFLPTYLSGISTPDIAVAESAENLAPAAQSEGTAGVSPQATPIRNLWGAATSEKVDLTLSRSDNAINWSWSRQHPVNRPGIDYVQPIYPNARIVLSSPVAVADIQSFYLVAGFNYTEPPTGDYNLAYDVFLREKGEKSPKAEIMVWLDWTLNQPSRNLKGRCSDGDNTYLKYWWTKADGSNYRSFLMTPPPEGIPRQINLKALIDLIEPEKDWYISEVELGTEVWKGSGAVELTTYYLELNGNRL